MNKNLLLLITTPIVILGLSFLIAPKASAFEPGNIIDDNVFTHANSMSVDQIQSFLNSKVPTCDTWGTQRSEFGGGTRRQWAEARGHSAPFTCLKDYQENGLSAAQIIYNKSREFSINPQVMLVLLQKEQSLVTDTWPISTQYKTATGYGCPDTAPCDQQYFGLSNQITWASRMFRSIMNASPGWYTPYVLGNNFIRYSPDASCGGSTVNIQNRATQALYNYTPYQPNRAALDAGWGSAPCGAYGNRNFYLYFTSWFGSTRTIATFAWQPTVEAVYADSSRTVQLPYNPIVAPKQHLYITIKAKNTGNQTWKKSQVNIGTSQPQDRTSLFRSSDWLSENRLATLQESQVEPGQTGTFLARLTTPEVLGNYSEYFNLVAEQVGWMNDPGLFIPLQVQTPREISLYSDSDRKNPLVSTGGQYQLYPNDTIYGSIKVNNVAAGILPSSVALATTGPADRSSPLHHPSWLGDNRVRKFGVDIKPGESSTIAFTLKAPATPGTYNESYGLVIDGPGGRWIEEDTFKFSTTVVQRPLDKLEKGSQLNAGQSLITANGNRLSMQADGNLVLYSASRVVWATGTDGSGANRVALQSDGNFVLYASLKPIWATGTDGSGANLLVNQADGNLVIYSPTRAVWATGTHN